MLNTKYEKSHEFINIFQTRFITNGGVNQRPLHFYCNKNEGFGRTLVTEITEFKKPQIKLNWINFVINLCAKQASTVTVDLLSIEIS